MPSRMLISRMVAEQIVRGSLEQQIGRVRQAILSAKLFGEDVGTPHIVATFSEHVVVGTESGAFFKVRFESKDGGLKVAPPERLPVEVYDESKMPKLVDQKLESVVDAALRGEKVSAKALAEAAELVGFDMFPPAQMAKRVVMASEDVARPWRKMFRSHRAQIRQYVESALPGIAGGLPEKKFAPLYSGKIEVATPEHDLAVKAALESLANRLSKTVSEAAEVYSKFYIDESKARSPKDAVVAESFKHFVEDFIDDVRSIAEAVDDLRACEGSARELAWAHDSVVSKMEDIEVAAVFIEWTVKRSKK